MSSAARKLGAAAVPNARPLAATAFRKRQRPMEIVGHRGCSARAPENSLSAIYQAFAVHADAVEFDLQRTKDGVVIVLHDDKLQRTAANTNPALTQAQYENIVATDVSDVDFADIKNIDVGAWKGPEWAGETVCTFEQALQAVAENPGKRCYPEIKRGHVDIVSSLQESVAAVGIGPERLTWISFDKNVMEAAKAAMPDYPALWVIEPKSTEEGLAQVEEAKAAGLDGVDVIADPTVVTAELVGAAQTHGLRVGVWVSSRLPQCDTEASWETMRELGVDFFTSDLPEPINQWGGMVTA